MSEKSILPIHSLTEPAPRLVRWPQLLNGMSFGNLLDHIIQRFEDVLDG
jgi:hypothetical protein